MFAGILSGAYRVELVPVPSKAIRMGIATTPLQARVWIKDVVACAAYAQRSLSY
jgi:hypothetical protein